VKVKLACLF